MSMIHSIQIKVGTNQQTHLTLHHPLQVVIGLCLQTHLLVIITHQKGLITVTYNKQRRLDSAAVTPPLRQEKFISSRQMIVQTHMVKRLLIEDGPVKRHLEIETSLGMAYLITMEKRVIPQMEMCCRKRVVLRSHQRGTQPIELIQNTLINCLVGPVRVLHQLEIADFASPQHIKTLREVADSKIPLSKRTLIEITGSNGPLLMNTLTDITDSKNLLSISTLTELAE